jgi:hypothetical protein
MQSGSIATNLKAEVVPIRGESRTQDARVLSSWKEIASYLNHGVRTVQRWERFYGLPVHRPAGKSRSAVIAVPEEIDAWVRKTALHPTLPSHALEAPAVHANKAQLSCDFRQCKQPAKLEVTIVSVANPGDYFTIGLCESHSRVQQAVLQNLESEFAVPHLKVGILKYLDQQTPSSDVRNLS